MALVDLIDIDKKFGIKVILEKANLSISEKSRTAIIGKNGGGKSTLMKIIAGLYKPDDGRVIVQNNINIQMLDQNPKFEDGLSVKEAITSQLKEIFDAIKEYEDTLNLISKNPEDNELLHKQNDLIKFIESKDGWNLDNKIERVIENFNLKEYENRDVNSLSGGEIRRVALSALILKKPDILLLDEPTNHLDVYMVKFLEDMLINSNQTIVFISHDRYFIDRVATNCIEIEDGRLLFFEGGYSKYLRKKQEILASMQKTHETLLKNLRSEEEWLRRGVKARLKRNEGRKQRIFAMREAAKKNPGVIRKIKIELERTNVGFKIGGITQNRKKMLFECKNLSKSLGGKKLFENFSARVLQGERIGIVGRNGTGKSTLLKILLGEMSYDSGMLKKGDIKIGYFDQTRSSISDDKTLIEIFCPNGGDHIMVKGRYMHVYGYLKNFLFPKEFLTQPVATLSGGEKNRLALAKLFTAEYDCLILDEPTNDLDIATINILEEYLLDFDGAVIVVSHDRYFVDKITNKLWIFEDEKINQSHMEYSEYLEYEDEIDELNKIEKEAIEQQDLQAKQKEKTQKLTYRQNKILEEHPHLIEDIENRIKELNHALSDPEIYQKLGLSELYEELEDKKGSLAKLENEYFEVLAIAESLEQE
ncbi:ABC transporter, ATP-binding protein [Campylobacter blaseri]|uniref:ABC transporter ATP-binding protein n=1 Tax=Campylobacter blaseri TaxID=2042961 RepID=A0A2P8QZS6_9BACT|nr:ABC-F family ATP-binding cassette domain-containing protein [Campylobacter blaseri]PSM51740.1 ABC transporter ATP-binding protein [Campylobacter blaseri]PSM53531.1 ABC transporter ATP-binding protein [Campylobacter blaseri]QKF86341.1 ABC transporter, ATP-binding protein [Campylobacter blaseri]